MSVELATAYVSVVPSTRGLSKQLQAQMGGPASAAGAASGKRLGGAMAGGIAGAARRAIGPVAAIVGAIGIGRVGKEIGGVATGAQRTEASLSALYKAAGHGAEEATVATRLLWDQFGRSSLGLEAFQGGAESLAYLGLNAEESVGVMGFLEDAILATGGSSQEMERVTRGLTNAMNRNKATNQELQQISGAGVPIYDMLAAQLGVTAGAVEEMASKGEISVDDLTTALQDGPGTWAPALREGADAVRDTLPVAWDSAKNTVVNAIAKNIMPMVDRLAPVMVTFGNLAAGAIEGFTAAVGAIGPIISGAGDVIQTVTGWVSDHSTAISWAAGIIGTLLLPTLATMAASFASVIAGWAAASAAAIASAARQVASWLMVRANQLASIAVMGVANAAVVAGWIQMAAASVAKAARMAASWVTAMGPVGWVIATITGLTALIVANWDTVVEWTRKAWDWIVGAVVDAWEWITGAVSDAVDAVIGFVSDLWSSVTGWVSDLVTDVVQFFKDLWTDVTSWVSDLVTDVVEFFKGLWTGVTGWADDLVTDVVQFYVDLWTRVTTWVSDLVSDVVGYFAGLYRDVVRWIQDLVGDVVGWFSGLPGRVWDALSGWASDLWDIAVEAVGKLLAGVVEIGKGVVRWFKELPDRLVAALGNIVERFQAIGRAIMDGLLAGVRGKKVGFVQEMGQIGSDAHNAVKRRLDIKSPSGVFREVGRDIMDGWQLGIEAGARGVLSEVGSVAVDAGGAGSVRSPRPDRPDVQGGTFHLYDSDNALIGTMRGVARNVQAADGRVEARRLVQQGGY